ncbi:MAG: ribosomal RNA small subunit methyltransferase A [Candidatus Aenigmarchaeota archaeon]|nr:ribosomal RNA small subunit methyltransferase A [Candidatus Aenigmarchaeota archaeon]
MKLSQNFLLSKTVAKSLCSAAQISKNDTVLEIGPGKRIITEELSLRAGKVIAVEADRDLCKLLEGKLSNNVQLISGDFLNVILPKFNKIVSNLPFKISSPALFRLFSLDWEKAVLILQKEFALRLVAKAGDRNYSRLSVASSFYCKAKILQTLPPTFFRPKPKVSAAVVLLEKAEPPFEASEEFWEFINKIFQHRKKILRAALKSAKLPTETKFGSRRVFTLNLSELKQVFEEICSVQTIKNQVSIRKQ